MTIWTVAISGVSPNPEVYGGLVAAGNYVGSRFGPTYTSWSALSDDDKGKTLVSATALLDSLAWEGDATGLVGVDATTLEWPRSGITLGDGTPLDDTTVPADIVSAAFELAVLIAADPTLVGKADTGSNISSVSAGGGVGVTFFNATSARSGTATTLPVIVQRLVGRFLATASGTGDGGETQGGNCVSSFRTAARFTVGVG